MGEFHLYARYLYPNDGHSIDKEKCEKHLTIGQRYLVTSVDMGGFYTSIKLAGIDERFNSVNFDFEDEDGTPHDIYTDPEYNHYLGEDES